MIYRTRVECRSTGDAWVPYGGGQLDGALDALHGYTAWPGETVTCECRTFKGPWTPLIVVHGGRPQVCPRCGGTGDGSTGGPCVGCQGRGVK